MKKIFLLIFCISFVALHMMGESYSFMMHIVDTLDSIPVADVSVRLIDHHNDSTLIKKEFSDNYGEVTFKNIESGEYLLHLDKEGYIPVSAILTLTKDVNLGDIGMTDKAMEGLTLDDVVVEGARTTIDAEGMTIIPQKELTENSTSLTELLRMLGLPGLTISPGEDIISINNGIPVIKVDGIRRSMQYLKTINPKNIAKIKYTHYPTTRYLQEGVGGVIEIFLKEINDGGTVYTKLNGCPYRKDLTGTLLSTYNFSNSEITVSVNEKWRELSHRYFHLIETRYDPEGNVTRTEDQNVDSPHNTNQLDASVSYTYQNRKGLAFTSAISSIFNHSYMDMHGSYTRDNIPDLHTYNRGGANSFNPSINLNLQKEWDDGKIIEANVIGAYNSSHEYSDAFEENTDGSATYITLDTKGKNFGFVANVQWSQPIGNVRWTADIKESYDHAKNRYSNSGTDIMNQTNTYFNTNLTGQSHMFSYYVGGGISYRHASSGTRTSSGWQPSAIFSFNQNINFSSISIKGHYNPIFPDLSELTSFQKEIGGNIIRGGNPLLKTVHQWDISLEAHIPLFKRKLWIMPSITNSHQNNLKISDYVYLPDGKYLSIRH